MLRFVVSLAMVFAAGATEWEARFSRGETLQRSGRYEEAAAAFEDALYGASPVETAVTRNNLGVVYRALGRSHDAERCYRAAIEFYEGRSEFEAALATVLDNLAALHLAAGRTGAAEPLYRRAYEIRVRTLAPGDAAISRSVQGLARLLQERGRWEEAERLYREALATGESAPLLHNLGTLLYERGRRAEARPLLERALMLFRQAGCRDAAIVLRYLGELDARNGDLPRAEAELKEAVAALPANGSDAAAILQAYGRFLAQTGRKKEAGPMLTDAQRILRQAAAENGSGYTVTAFAASAR